MKLLIICAVLSVGVALSLASPLKTQVHDESESSASAESMELKISENESSSSEEELKTENVIVKDSSSDSSEELSDKDKIVKDPVNENNSVEEQELADDFIISRPKRAVIFATPSSNQLTVKDEGTIKYEKYLKLIQVKQNLRKKRSPESSEENSSEEKNKDKNHAESNGENVDKKSETAAKQDVALTESDFQAVDIRRRRNSSDADSSQENSSEEGKQETSNKEAVEAAKKPDAVPSEGEHKSETSRRKRSLEDFSDEVDQSQQQTQDDNEVFMLSKEKETDDTNESNEDFDNKPQIIFSENNFEAPESLPANKTSEEDYAQGCGGNRSDNSNEISNEQNETLNDNL